MSYITQFDASSVAPGLTDILGGENINITGASPVLTVNLDNVIRWPDTNAAATTGVIYLGAVAAVGGNRFLHNFTDGAAVGAGTFNAFLGDGAGNFTLSTAIGDNMCVGSRAMVKLTTGGGNSALGAEAFTLLSTGNYNAAIGFRALSKLLTGTNNLAIGAPTAGLIGVGDEYVAAESSNILLSHIGVVGDSNTMRLGTDGSSTSEVDTTFIAGVRGVAVLADGLPMVIDSTFQVGTSGTVAISFPTDAGTAVPSVGALTIAGGTNIATSGAGSTVTVNFDGTLPVASGGTGLTTLTDHGVLLGSGTADVTVTAVGTDGQVLVGATGADPVFATLTSADSTIDFATGTNTLDLTTGATVPVSFATDSGSAVPAAGVITIAGGTNVTTSGAGSTVTIDASGGGGGITWAEVTGTTQAMDVDTGYVANNAGLVTLTLPDTAAFGSIVRVVGKGAGGFLIAQNAAEFIRWDEASVTTTGVGGSLASTDNFDAIELVCMTADTEWVVLSSKGNITIV